MRHYGRMSKQHTVQQVVARSRERPTILVSLQSDRPGWLRLLGAVREKDWRLLDLRFRSGDLPPDFAGSVCLVCDNRQRLYIPSCKGIEDLAVVDMTARNLQP